MRRTYCLVSTVVLIASTLTTVADEPPRTTPTPTPDSRSASAVRLEAGANSGPVNESARREFDAQPQPFSLEQMTVGRPPLQRSRFTPLVRPVFPGSPETPHPTGAKSIPTPPAGSIGVTAEADGAGGFFEDSDSSGLSYLGVGGLGIDATGDVAGGHFTDSDASGYAWVGHSDAGIEAGGDLAGGLFVDSNGTGEAWVGHEDFGIEARGNEMGGYFENSVTLSNAQVGTQDYGIIANGNAAGGNFFDLALSASALLAHSSRGISAQGYEMGGYFEDLDGSGFAHLGWGNTGVFGRGNAAGGVFDDEDGSGYARAGYGDRGVDAGGHEMGGYFVDSDGSGYIKAGFGDHGVEAGGSEMGGHLKDSDGSGYSYVGIGNRGIVAAGNEAGGIFHDLDHSGYSYIGYGDRGIEAYGDDMGGFFKANAGTGEANLAIGNRGIEAYGTEMGGYFEDPGESGFAHLGWGNTGVFGRGNVAGGTFDDGDGSGYARAGFGDRGVDAGGTEMGGYFEDSDGTGYANVGTGDRGIEAFGEYEGGYFENTVGTGVAAVGAFNVGIYASGSFSGGDFSDTTRSTWAYVASSTHKIEGNGTVNFIQNHPYDSSSVIVYTAPEGDEVATYTRGTAALVDGEATVRLGDTFKWVTNPDIGLTAYLTPVGGWCDLYVTEKSTDHITVRSLDGLDCAFDFLVYGLRIGFEEISPVKEKEREAYIPSMASHRDLNQRRPELRELNSLERFKTMVRAVSGSDEVDLSRAHALRDAIIEFDPAVHELPRPARDGRNPGTANTSTRRNDGGKLGEPPTRAGSQESTAAPSHFASAQMIPMDEDGDVYARSFRPSAGELANLLEVSEPVEAGDVLVMDPTHPGAMRRAVSSADGTVVGVVAAAPGVVLGSEPGAESQAAAVSFSGITACKVDASFGPIYPGDLLVTSPTPGHAQRADVPLPGTVLGKAMEEHTNDTGTIKVLVMLR